MAKKRSVRRRSAVFTRIRRKASRGVRGLGGLMQPIISGAVYGLAAPIFGSLVARVSAIPANLARYAALVLMYIAGKFWKPLRQAALIGVAIEAAQFSGATFGPMLSGFLGGQVVSAESE